MEFPVAEGTVITAGDVTGIVPQNVTLAPPTAMIYVATGGTIDLTSEANKGVSFTEAQIKELGADFNFIPAQEGGGGGGLPPYTSADKGKGLFLGDGEGTETVVIVPEQSGTCIDLASIGATGLKGFKLEGADEDFFRAAEIGDTITEAGISQSTYTAVELAAGIIVFRSPAEPYIFVGYVADGVYYASGLFSVGSKIEVSNFTASVPSVEPKWESLLIDTINPPSVVREVENLAGGTVTFDSSVNELAISFDGETDTLLPGEYIIADIQLPLAILKEEGGEQTELFVPSLTRSVSDAISDDADNFFVSSASNIKFSASPRIVIISPDAVIKYGTDK